MATSLSFSLSAGDWTWVDGFTLTMPSSVPAGFTADGTVYVGMVTDPEWFDAVVETSETDNANRGVGLDSDMAAAISGEVRASGPNRIERGSAMAPIL